MIEPEVFCRNGELGIECTMCDVRFSFTGDEDPALARAFYSIHVHDEATLTA